MISNAMIQKWVRMLRHDSVLEKMFPVVIGVK